jgi:hypothetical protein
MGKGCTVQEMTVAKYDFRNQKVNQQFIADRDMPIGSIQNVGKVESRGDFIAELERLKAVMAAASRDGQIDRRRAADAEHHIAQAIIEAEEPKPDRTTLLDRLNGAKQLIDDVTTLGTAAAGLGALIDAAQHLFS